MESVQIRSFFWSVFSCIWTEIYGVNLRIQSEYRKIRTRKNSVFGHFSRSVTFINNSKSVNIHLKWSPFYNKVPECRPDFSLKKLKDSCFLVDFSKQLLIKHLRIATTTGVTGESSARQRNFNFYILRLLSESARNVCSALANQIAHVFTC